MLRPIRIDNCKTSQRGTRTGNKWFSYFLDDDNSQKNIWITHLVANRSLWMENALLDNNFDGYSTSPVSVRLLLDPGKCHLHYATRSASCNTAHIILLCYQIVLGKFDCHPSRALDQEKSTYRLPVHQKQGMEASQDQMYRL